MNDFADEVLTAPRSHQPSGSDPHAVLPSARSLDCPGTADANVNSLPGARPPDLPRSAGAEVNNLPGARPLDFPRFTDPDVDDLPGARPPGSFPDHQTPTWTATEELARRTSLDQQAPTRTPHP